jgi:glycosyltransferase involved in cell wall biosynthesis
MRESNRLLMACNEPMVAALAPDRCVVRFEWSTGLPRFWKLPGWLPRFQRAKYLFLSRSDQEEFLRDYPLIPAESTFVIPYYVDPGIFQPLHLQTPGALRVGFAGQWVPRKGLNELLDAWRSVKSALPKAELHMGGGAALWRATEESVGASGCDIRIREMAAEGMLHIVGAVPRGEMPGFWNSLNVAVVPSLYEPFGLVALEALACGIPVVATAVGGLKEIVEDGESGLLVPPGDASALAQALLTLLTNEPLRLRLGEGARKRALQFSAERRSRELRSLFEKMEPRK